MVNLWCAHRAAVTSLILPMISSVWTDVVIDEISVSPDNSGSSADNCVVANLSDPLVAEDPNFHDESNESSLSKS